MVIHGKDIQIYNASGTVLLAKAKSCTIRKKCNVIEKASETSSNEEEYEPGRSSWTVELTHLIATGLDGIPLVGTKYQINVKVNGTQAATGTVICTLADVQATMGYLATGSIKMQGTGHLG